MKTKVACQCLTIAYIFPQVASGKTIVSLITLWNILVVSIFKSRSNSESIRSTHYKWTPVRRCWRSVFQGWKAWCLAGSFNVINNEERISPRRWEGAHRNFPKILSTDTEPDSLVPFRINGIKVLYLESRLLLGSRFYGPWTYLLHTFILQGL